jgi:hypothetical protein
MAGRPSQRDRLLGGSRSISAVVAFVGMLLGIIFVLWPSLTPHGPPATKSATLQKLTLDRNVTFGQYLDRIEHSQTPFEPNTLARRGALVEFEFIITGYRDKRLPLRWQLIDAETGDQIDRSRDILIAPSATTERGTWNVWVPNPKRRSRRLFVQLQLYDERAGGRPIGRLRTPLFTSTQGSSASSAKQAAVHGYGTMIVRAPRGRALSV